MRRNVERIVLIGCGGIGTWVLAPLLRFLNAERFAGDVVLWDGDRYTAQNADRQDFAGERIGRNKADVQAQCYSARFPGLRVWMRDEFVTQGNVTEAVVERSIVLVAVDNHPARCVVARQAERLRDVCVLSAGNEKLDGNVHVTLRRGARDMTAPLLARHPEIARIKSGDRAEAGCEERLAQGETQLLVTNFLAAASLLSGFWLIWTHGNPVGRRKATSIPQEIFFDASTCAMSLLPAHE